MMALTFAITVIGLAALAMAMDRYVEYLPRALAGRGTGWVFRVLGCSALGSALVLLEGVTGHRQALLTWIGFFAPGTLLVAMGMALVERTCRRR